MKESDEMDAWTQMNQAIVADRIRERTSAASAERLATVARSDSARIVRERRFRLVIVGGTGQAQSRA
jgi:hypothetical protein